MKKSLSPNARNFLIFILFLAVCLAAGWYFDIDRDYYRSLLEGVPLAFSGPVFVFLYSALTFFIWAAKDILKIVGAVMFGAYWSALFIWLAEIVNACVLFQFSRRLGRGFVEEKERGLWAKLDKRIEDLRFFDLFLLRAVILIPYRFLDLAAGLTKMPFKKYLTAVVVGSLPRVFFIQFFLALVGFSFDTDHIFDMAEYLSHLHRQRRLRISHRRASDPSEIHRVPGGVIRSGGTF